MGQNVYDAMRKVLAHKARKAQKPQSKLFQAIPVIVERPSMGYSTTERAWFRKPLGQ
jgi:hypothetical protein